MKSHHFLRSIAHQCKEQFGDQCDQLQIIFPNKRAGVYFANYLAELYDKPIWSPNINSFEEFVESHQQHKLADELQLSFLLYSAYKSIVPNVETFDAFLPWGEMILKDFNDIDNYLVETSHIFRVIKSQKELDELFQEFSTEREKQIIEDFWQGFLPEPDRKQQEFIKTWAILDELYKKFNALLDQKQLTYKGKLFKSYVNDLTNVKASSNIWFVGFNALTKAEEQIVKHYLQGGKSDIFWDIDEHYVKDTMQEAGEFFREYAKDSVFKPSIERDIQNRINHSTNQIELVSAPFGLGQIHAARQKLENLTTSQLEKTLLILTDETMLNNVLDYLPANVHAANITMGWPIIQSRIYLLMQNLILLQTRISEEGFSRLYFKDVHGLLEFKDLLELDDEKVLAFDNLIKVSNHLYFTLDEVKDHFPILDRILSKAVSTSDYILVLVRFIESLDLKGFKESESSVLVMMHALMKRVISASHEFGIAIQMKSFLKIFKRMGTTQKLSFSGDINRGLQVMGILETRNLSFENVMIIGMNEDAWPKDSSNSSFVPYNVRKAFGLPVIEHQDAMQSYLFYRLLHSADNLWISYNNISAFNRNGELSRYVQQLQFESDIAFTQTSVSNKIAADPIPEIEIAKEGKVLEKLNAFLVGHGTRKLSPSALSTYIDCSLKFYFNYIEQIYEPDEVLEDIKPNLLGNLLHGAMENLYTGERTLTTERLYELKSKIDEALVQSFEEQHLVVSEGEKEFMVGRQLIVYEVIKQYMDAIVNYDANNAPFDLIGLEFKDFFVDFPIETLEGSELVSLKGIIDRVDEYRSVVRVIDYKSGRDEREFGDMEEMINSESKSRPKGVFQLFYYCMLYKENHPDNTLPIQPGMFNSKDLFKSDFDIILRQKKGQKESGRKGGLVLNYEDYEEQFKGLLQTLLTDIFNIMQPFAQTKDETKCGYCPYINICMKG